MKTTLPVPISVELINLHDNSNNYSGEEFNADFEWHCPTCGSLTLALSSEKATAEEIAADARCCYCRGFKHNARVR
jgi:hypothetical protein